MMLIAFALSAVVRFCLMARFGHNSASSLFRIMIEMMRYRRIYHSPVYSSWSSVHPTSDVAPTLSETVFGKEVGRPETTALSAKPTSIWLQFPDHTRTDLIVYRPFTFAPICLTNDRPDDFVQVTDISLYYGDVESIISNFDVDISTQQVDDASLGVVADVLADTAPALATVVNSGIFSRVEPLSVSELHSRVCVNIINEWLVNMCFSMDSPVNAKLVADVDAPLATESLASDNGKGLASEPGMELELAQNATTDPALAATEVPTLAAVKKELDAGDGFALSNDSFALVDGVVPASAESEVPAMDTGGNSTPDVVEELALDTGTDLVVDPAEHPSSLCGLSLKVLRLLLGIFLVYEVVNAFYRYDLVSELRQALGLLTIPPLFGLVLLWVCLHLLALDYVLSRLKGMFWSNADDEPAIDPADIPLPEGDDADLVDGTTDTAEGPVNPNAKGRSTPVADPPTHSFRETVPDAKASCGRFAREGNTEEHDKKRQGDSPSSSSGVASAECPAGSSSVTSTPQTAVPKFEKSTDDQIRAFFLPPASHGESFPPGGGPSSPS